MIRVISGSYKGRRLKLVPSPSVRPMQDKVKGALFSILGDRLKGSMCLDGFAGTGSVGIEALSRGAYLAIFVEENRKIAQTLRENLELTGFSDRAEIYCLDVIKALKVIDKGNAKFDIVFIGAPYNDPALKKTLECISLMDIIEKNGIVVAEHSIRDELALSYNKLSLLKDSRYGDTVLSFYKAGEGA